MSSPGNMEQAYTICKLPSKGGTAGKRLCIEVNMAQISFGDELKTVFIYAVYLDSPQPEHIRRQAVDHIFHSLGHGYAYDGILLYLPAKLQKHVLRRTIPHPNQLGGQLDLRIMYRTKCPLGQCGRLIKFLLGSLPLVLGCRKFGRVCYDPNSMRRLPQSDIDVYGAYRIRFAQAETPLLAILDVVHVFRRRKTLMQIFKDMRRNKVNFKDEFKDYCLGRAVTNYDANYVTNICGVSFKQEKGCVSPVLWASKPARGSCPTVKKEPGAQINPTTYSVMVTRKGQPPLSVDKGKITEFTRISPALRVDCIKRFLHAVTASYDCNMVLQKWKMKVEPALLSVEARVIPPPLIEFGDGRVLSGKKLCWNPKNEAPAYRFVEPRKFENWKIFCAKSDVVLAEKLVSSMVCEGVRFGVNILRGKIVTVSLKNHPHLTAAFADRIIEKTKERVQFAVVVLPEVSGTEFKNIYVHLKKICASDRAIVSQMINARTITVKAKDSRSWDMLVGSLIGNLTCKLGGILWSVQIPLEKIMFVGLDVWHGSITESHSIGAVVCTINQRMSKIYSSAIRHDYRQEIFDDIQIRIVLALKLFREENCQLPDRIVIYRDGINRRYYGKVLEREIPQILAAVKEIYGKSQPMMSFVVVQKRIYERFFVKNEKGCYVNVPVGTIIDHTVTRKKCYDFFLCSMRREKGTVVPTHCVMLYDNSAMCPDTFQKITYAMCYSYCNWPGSFYVPSVIQYAHKLAGHVGRCGVFPPDSLSSQLHFL